MYLSSIEKEDMLPWQAVVCVHPGMDKAVEGTHHGPHRVPHRHLNQQTKSKLVSPCADEVSARRSWCTSEHQTEYELDVSTVKKKYTSYS